MKKALSSWMKILKIVVFLLAGLIPAVVFREYANPGDTYDSFYTLIVWGTLIVLELAEMYTKSKEENNEDKGQR